MAKPIDQLVEILSRVIYHEGYSNLNEHHKFFIHRHFHEFETYRKEISRAARTAMQAVKLSSRDYQCILCWYCLRIPAPFVLKAINALAAWAKENGSQINSVKYFRKAILRDIYVAEKRGYKFAFNKGNRDLWLYKAYRDWENGQNPGMKFNPMFGPDYQTGWER
jgi:hypothetical protein